MKKWILSGLCISLSSILVADITWSTPISISNTEQQSYENTVGCSGAMGNVAAGWVQGLIAPYAFYSAASASGSSWTPESGSQVSGSSSFVDAPKIAMDSNGNAIAVWVEGNDQNTAVIRWAAQPYGQSWSTPANLSTGAGAFPKITIDNQGNALAAWSAFLPDGTSHIQTAFKPFGESWALNSSYISGISMGVLSITLAFSDTGDAYIAWSRTDNAFGTLIETSKLPSGTTTWATPTIISNPGTAVEAPSIVVDSGNNVTVIWQSYDGTSETIQAAQLLSGNTWMAPITYPSSGLALSFPSIGIDNRGNIQTAWQAYDGTNYYVQASEILNGQWAPSTTISSASNTHPCPKMAVDATGNTTVVWSQFDGSNFFIQSITKPANGFWQTEQTVSSAGLDMGFPVISKDAIGNIFVIWNQFNGTNHVIQAAQGVCLQPPSNFTAVAVLGASGTLSNAHSLLTWTASTSSDVAGYYIYRNGSHIATVDSTTTQYQDPIATKVEVINYSIVAYDNEGFVSARVLATIE